MAGNVEGHHGEAAAHERLDELRELRASPFPAVHEEDGRGARAPAPGRQELSVVGDGEAIRGGERLLLPGRAAVASRGEEEVLGVAGGERRGVWPEDPEARTRGANRQRKALRGSV